MVTSYNRTEVILNSSILKPSSLFSFFVKDGDVMNSTYFWTVATPNASFALSNDTYDGLTQNLSLVVTNFYVGMVYSYRYRMSVTESGGEVVFISGVANLTALGNYTILFRMPLTSSDYQVNMTILLWN